MTGEAIASDNCSDVTPTFIDNVNIDNCGNGTVTRIWSVSDDSGNSASCVQFITVQNSAPFFICDTKDRTTPFLGCGFGHSNDDGVEWPADIELSTCGAGLSPADLDASHPLDARPQIFEGVCDQIAVTYEDTYLPIQEPACIKILRKWIVVDWCEAVNNPDPTQPGPGVYHYVQVIKVVNSTPPQVFPGGDSFVGNFEENCGAAFAELFVNATDDCTPEGDLEYSYIIETAAGNLVSSGSGSNASGAFANGEYKITWTVTDGCGNAFSAIHTLTVEDAKKPTPVCINGLSTVIMPSAGAVTIWATDFESGSSFDNCTPYSALQFSFSPDVNLSLRHI